MKPNDGFKKELLDALSDDINISKALSFVDEMITFSNEELDKNPKDKSLHFQIFANLELVKDVLGIGQIDTTEYFQLGVSDEEKSKIKLLISQRDEAKKAKDYAKADKIRDELLSLNINVLDTPNGTFWEKSESK